MPRVVVVIGYGNHRRRLINGKFIGLSVRGAVACQIYRIQRKGIIPVLREGHLADRGSAVGNAHILADRPAADAGGRAVCVGNGKLRPVRIKVPVRNGHCGGAGGVVISAVGGIVEIPGYRDGRGRHIDLKRYGLGCAFVVCPVCGAGSHPDIVAVIGVRVHGNLLTEGFFPVQEPVPLSAFIDISCRGNFIPYLPQSGTGLPCLWICHVNAQAHILIKNAVLSIPRIQDSHGHLRSNVVQNETIGA